MFNKLLKSIVADINLLYSLNPDVMGYEQYNSFLDSINYKIRSIENFDKDFWFSLYFDCHSFCDTKKAINNYLKLNK